MDRFTFGFLAVVACFIVVILVQPGITGQAVYGKYDLTSLGKYADVLETEISDGEIIEEDSIDVPIDDEEMLEKELYDEVEFDASRYKPKFSIPVEEPEPEESSCCIDPEAVDMLIDQVQDLEEKVAELEERSNQQCTPVTISRGSCQDTCQSQSLRCTASLYRREVTERSIFGDTSAELFSTIDDCDDDWYFPNDPDVKDTRTCVCC